MNLSENPIILDWMSPEERELRTNAPTFLATALSANGYKVDSLSFFQQGHSSIVAKISLKSGREVVAKFSSNSVPLEAEKVFYSLVKNRIRAPEVYDLITHDNIEILIMEYVNASPLTALKEEEALKSGYYTEMGRLLALIHTIKVNPSVLPRNDSHDISAEEIVERAEEINAYSRIITNTDVDFLIEQLRVFTDSRDQTLIHGDYHPGNILLEKGGLLVFDPYPGIQNPSLEVGRCFTAFAKSSLRKDIFKQLMSGYTQVSAMPDESIASGVAFYSFRKILTAIRKNDNKRFNALVTLFEEFKQKI